MPDSRMIYKAGRLSFLLVCLFLCTACKSEKAVFQASEQTLIEAERKEEKTEQVFVQEKLEEEHLVNINTADAAELMTLPGIGKVRAKAIIEYREKTGVFEKIEDVMNVKGIKTGIFSKINSLICVK